MLKPPNVVVATFDYRRCTAAVLSAGGWPSEDQAMLEPIYNYQITGRGILIETIIQYSNLEFSGERSSWNF